MGRRILSPGDLLHEAGGGGDGQTPHPSLACAPSAPLRSTPGIYHLIAHMVKNPPTMQATLVRFLGWEDSPGDGLGYPLQYSWASLVAQLVKNPPAMWETCVRFLGWEDSPGEGKGCPLQYSCLENLYGQRSLVGYSS